MSIAMELQGLIVASISIPHYYSVVHLVPCLNLCRLDFGRDFFPHLQNLDYLEIWIISVQLTDFYCILYFHGSAFYRQPKFDI